MADGGGRHSPATGGRPCPGLGSVLSADRGLQGAGGGRFRPALPLAARLSAGFAAGGPVYPPTGASKALGPGFRPVLPLAARFYPSTGAFWVQNGLLVTIRCISCVRTTKGNFAPKSALTGQATHQIGPYRARRCTKSALTGQATPQFGPYTTHRRPHSAQIGRLPDPPTPALRQISALAGQRLLQLDGSDVDNVLAGVLGVGRSAVTPVERFYDRRRFGGAGVEGHRSGCIPADEVAATAGHHQVFGQVGMQRRLIPDLDDRLEDTDVRIFERPPCGARGPLGPCRSSRGTASATVRMLVAVDRTRRMMGREAADLLLLREETSAAVLESEHVRDARTTQPTAASPRPSRRAGPVPTCGASSLMTAGSMPSNCVPGCRECACCRSRP